MIFGQKQQKDLRKNITHLAIISLIEFGGASEAEFSGAGEAEFSEAGEADNPHITNAKIIVIVARTSILNNAAYTC